MTALADGSDQASREIARQLRHEFERNGTQYDAVCEALLEVTDRRLARGVELGQLRQVLFAVIDHAVDAGQIGVSPDPAVVLDSVLRIWRAFTRPRDRDPTAETAAEVERSCASW